VREAGIVATKRVRADTLLVELGLAESRERAQALILAGAVYSGARRVDKAGDRLPSDAPLRVTANPLPYVGRGGIKLAAALDRFAIDPAGLTVLDVGASTGGFTDCLLQRGARRVYALDVGRGQLHWRLRQDPRVSLLEGVNARYLTAAALPERIDLVTIDVAFISLRLVVPPVRLAAAPAAWVLLVKPQFEIGRDEVGAGGIVREPEKHRRVLEAALALAAAEGLSAAGLIASPVTGAEGNREFLLHLRAGGVPVDPAEAARWIEEATA
jgi:23S rRNA (cytidine1920-2'-O)/16S rRNA (cytidine1409-2'-O)-methyltransferase